MARHGNRAQPVNARRRPFCACRMEKRVADSLAPGLFGAFAMVRACFVRPAVAYPWDCFCQLPSLCY